MKLDKTWRIGKILDMKTESYAKKIFAENLNLHLKMNNKKQADLAKYLGCSTGLVSAWCAGRKMPRVNTINEICLWFHIEMSDMLDDWTGKKNVYERREDEKIATALLENKDLHDIMAICVKMPPKKLSALLDFLSS